MTQKPVTYIPIDNTYIFECPHCNSPVQVLKNQVKCKIFRHAIYKNTGKQIGPHLPKKKCDNLIKRDLVYGCAKPFQLYENKNGDITHAEICNYI